MKYYSIGPDLLDFPSSKELRVDTLGSNSQGPPVKFLLYSSRNMYIYNIDCEIFDESCCMLIHDGSNDEVALSQALNTLHGIVLVRSFLEI